VALVRAGRLDEAIDHLYQALKLSPMDADIHNNLGLALHEAHNDEESIQQFHAAVRLNPDHIVALDNLATLLLDMDRRQEAAVLYRAAMSEARGRGNSEVAQHASNMLAEIERGTEVQP
jgi:Flp pilus assembly protein TadD